MLEVHVVLEVLPAGGVVVTQLTALGLVRQVGAQVYTQAFRGRHLHPTHLPCDIHDIRLYIILTVNIVTYTTSDFTLY